MTSFALRAPSGRKVGRTERLVKEMTTVESKERPSANGNAEKPLSVCVEDTECMPHRAKIRPDHLKVGMCPVVASR